MDCVATSEVSVSLTLDPAKMWSRDLVQELDALVSEFEEIGIARVTVTTGHSLISLIGNVERNNEIMERGFRALGEANVKVKMISQGASKRHLLVISDEQRRNADAIHKGSSRTSSGKSCPRCRATKSRNARTRWMYL